MKTKPATKTSAVSVICFILAVIFFLYGIYMILYSVDYIRSYESTGLINTQNALQYVITSSASYFGFAFLLFAAGYAIRMLKKMQPAYSGVITEYCEEIPESEMNTAETSAEESPELETPEAEAYVPEIGNTSSALTFHELIIDTPEEETAPEEPAVEEPADISEELQEEPAAVSEEEPPAEETPAEEPAVEEMPMEEPVAEKKPAEPEKISSSMIRDIFEHK